jgi:hypothetical protein
MWVPTLAVCFRRLVACVGNEIALVLWWTGFECCARVNHTVGSKCDWQ